ncbi:hypothetical protein OS493_032368 [Desmophyllum pertusum]|uniref:Beta-1,4-galactosyltransferase n=1 Tax=Desmophyllum pertusum TaxID=174260 RepID=A0A9W9YJD5_9CNID|nr:hypothetical protein OS493_032368 [Desmophyllum pertusum]
MTGLSKLKKFMLCAFIVATVSFLVMFYYSVNFSNYSKLLGLKQEGTSKRGIDRDLNEQTLFPVNSTAPSNFSDTGASKQREINMVITQPSLRSTSTEQKLVREDIKVLKNTTNSSNTKPTATGVIEQNKATKPNLAPNSNKESVGPLYVDEKIPKMKDVENEMSSEFKGGWVNKGGSWKPTECKARVKMALIIPYRNRYEQLSIFVRHMHPMLKRQNVDYRILVIEQAGDTVFNRAMLFNIGFKEALKFDQYDCFIFHDVDLIPEDDRNEYSCPSSPRHLSVAVDKFNYRQNTGKAAQANTAVNAIRKVQNVKDISPYWQRRPRTVCEAKGFCSTDEY